MKKINQNPSLKSAHDQQGLTLVEILVALVISLFLITGVIQLFVGTKQSYRGHDALSRIQENGRFALNTITRDIRMAGYTPHPSSATPCPTPIATPPVPPFIQTTSNSIQVWWCDPGPASPQCTPANGLCNRGYTITCTGGEATPCNGTGDLLLQTEMMGGGGPQPFIEGVANMQITPVFCPGSATTTCSVRIDLLMVSLDRFLATQPQTVIFPPGSGIPYTAPDRRFAQIFSTTVAIRNP